MIQKIDKRVRADHFRQRLQRALQDADATQSGLSRAIGVDRSTISQLLSDGGARLPNAHVVGACASALGVSADWLLSLSDRPESATDLLSNSLSVTKAPRALVDEQLIAWHQEAAGYKIRHVPAQLPDMLKTHEMLEWEYSPHLGRTATQAINASSDRLTLMRDGQSDFEIAMPIYEMDSFAAGAGYYQGLPDDVRAAQLDRFIDLSEALYPRLRIYLFDAKRLFSSPITIFGPLISVIYLGSHYMAFRDKDRIEVFTSHFDRLIREADTTARDLPDYLRSLRAQL